MGHACLHYPRLQGAATWTFVPAVAERNVRHADPVTVPVTGPLSVNNSEALRDAAIEGLGIALLPDFSAQSALETGRLVEVLPEWRSAGAFGDWLYAIRPYSRACLAGLASLRGVLARVLRASGFTSTPPTLI